jgi:hypothetical protein
MTMVSRGLDGDILRGAGEISAFLFGSAKERRKVYHLRDKSKLPTFRIGATICARRTKLLSWIEEQERSALKVA